MRERLRTPRWPRGKHVAQRLRVEATEDPLDISEFAAKLEAPALKLALYRCFDEIKALRGSIQATRRERGKWKQ